MQLLLILIVLTAGLSADLVSSEPVAGGGLRVLLTAATVALVMLVAQLAARVTSFRLRANFANRHAFVHAFARWKSLHLICWAVGSLTILFAIEWPRMVRANWQLTGTFLLDEALILLPVLTPLLFSWAAFYEVDRTFDRFQVSRDGGVSRLPGCFRYVLTHARHHLGLLLIPLVLIVAFQDVATFVLPDTHGGELPLLAYLPLLAAMVVLLPYLLRLIWPTERLAEGALRARLHRVSGQLGVPVREIYVWKTDRMITNAAVAGFVPRFRYVFLSDSLLASMGVDEIAAIFAHELGHVRYRHLPLRVSASLVPLAIWMAGCATFPEAVTRIDGWTAGLGLPFIAATPLMLLVVMAVYARTVMASYSRRLEHEADLEACRDEERNGHHTRRAAVRFVEMLERLTALTGQSHTRRSWLHPSTAQRTRFITTAFCEPEAALAFQIRTRRLSRLFVLLLLMGVVWWALAVVFARSV